LRERDIGEKSLKERESEIFESLLIKCQLPAQFNTKMILELTFERLHQQADEAVGFPLSYCRRVWRGVMIVLQCVAVCCSVLQCVAVRRSSLSPIAAGFGEG